MYKCEDCGHVFDKPDLKRENIGEYQGAPAYQTVYSCPACGGDYEEAEECNDCEEYFLSDELEDGLCPLCYDNRINEWFNEIAAEEDMSEEDMENVLADIMITNDLTPCKTLADYLRQIRIHGYCPTFYDEEELYDWLTENDYM